MATRLQARLISIGIVLVLVATIGALSTAVDARKPSPSQPSAPFVPGELIVAFQSGATVQSIANLYREFNLVEKTNHGAQGRGRQQQRDGKAPRLVVAHGQQVQQLIDRLERDPRVRYAEPNYILSIDALPNDPLIDQLWALENTGQTGGTDGADIDAAAGWEISTGVATVVVGVIDTGIHVTHEDLAGNIWNNLAEIDGTAGVDDDGNGYVDDFHGINAITNDGNLIDDHGHGTHVSGTIGAVGNNGIGVSGVAQNVQIAGCKFLDAGGNGTTADAIQCFQYFNALNAQFDVNFVATNNSWGGGGFSQALMDSMAGLDQPGMAPILHLAAAGNSNNNNDAASHYPSSYDLENIVAVAATDHNDLYAGFSSYGASSVDLAAPGVNILSTVPTGSCTLCDPTGYGVLQGTSMATPHVTGAAALVWAAYPTSSAADVSQRILTGVDPLLDVSKATATAGRLNLAGALEHDTAPPAAITTLAAAGNDRVSIDLVWLATDDDADGVGRASSYDLRYASAPIDATTWANATPAVGEPTPQPVGQEETFTLSSLLPGTTYYVALRAIDNVGNPSGLSNVLSAATAAGTIFFQDDIESGINGWTSTGLWHQSARRSTSPTAAWYYGIEGVWNYSTGISMNSGTLQSPRIDLSGATEAQLLFDEWSEVEGSANYDRTRVQLSSDGSTWLNAFESHGTANVWQSRTIDLAAYLDGDLYVRFWFDTVDWIGNGFEGWHVDSIAVIGPAPSGLAAPIVHTASDSDATVPGVDGSDFSLTWTRSTSSDVVAQDVYLLSTGTALNIGPHDYVGTVAPAIEKFSGDSTRTTDSAGVPLVAGEYTLYVVARDDADNTSVSAGAAMTAVDDVPGITVTPTSGLETTEAGGTDSFAVVLDTLPTADVTIDLTSSAEDEGTRDVPTLTFTPTNGMTAQTVTVTGVDDDVDDGDIPYTIFVSINAAATGDSVYDGLDAADVAVTNTDDDEAGITVTPTSGLVTTEAGDADSLDIVLDSEPTDPVTIGLSSSNTGEGTVEPDYLVFTSADWDTPQTVTVTGVDDPIEDPDTAYTIITAAAVSSDTLYGGLDAANVAVTNTDDDDTTAPALPTLLSANDPDNTEEGVDGGDFSLTWTRSTSSDVVAQDVYLLPTGTALNIGHHNYVGTVAPAVEEFTGDSARTTDSAGAPLTAGEYTLYVVALDGADNASIASATMTAVAESPPPDTTLTHVDNIKMSAKHKGSNWDVKATVTIRDESGDLVADAVVTIRWEIDNVLLFRATATTNGKGRVNFSTGRLPDLDGTTVSILVIGVDKLGTTFDPIDPDDSYDVPPS